MFTDPRSNTSGSVREQERLAEAICGITTVLLVFIFGQTRVFLAMSRDGMVPQSMVKIHPKYGTPDKITIFTGATICVLSGLLPINIIAELCNMGTLFAFCMVSIGVMVLRKTAPNIKRPFRCPAVFIVAPLAVLLCGFLVLQLPRDTFLFFGIWCTLGVVVYFTYSSRNTRLIEESNAADDDNEIDDSLAPTPDPISAFKV